MEINADNETTLSDFKEHKFEPAPVLLCVSGSTDNGSAEKLKAALAELDSEKQARKEAEKAKEELESSFARLELLYQQAIRQRDEALRHKDEALRVKDDVTRKLANAVEARDDAFKQRDEMQLQRDDILRQKEEALKIRDTLKEEIEAATRLLVTASDNITSMASGIMAFSGGLPTTTNYTGVTAIAYGFTKRVEEVVGEVLRQCESALKGRNDMHSQIEQRNIQIAIEVSELEATISHLKEGMRKKGDECERWQMLTAEKDNQSLEIERDLLKKLNVITKDADLSTKRMVDAESRAKLLELELQKHNELFVKQFQMLSKASESLLQFSQVMHSDGNIQDTFSMPSLQAHETEKMHEACLRAWRSISDMAAALTISWQETEETRQKDREELERKMERLAVKEREASALDIEVNDLRQKVLELEKSLAKIRSEGDKLRLLSTTQAKDLSEKAASVQELEQNALALDIEVNNLRQKVLELEKSLANTRLEANKLRFLSNTQAKDLSSKAAYVEELEQKASDSYMELKNLRQKVLKIEKSLDETRFDADKLSFLSNTQAKDLSEKAAYVEELKQKESALNIELNDLRQKGLELESSLAETRSEADKLRFLSNTQAEDLSDKAAYVEELEQKASALDIEVNDLRQKSLELEKSLSKTISEADKLRFLSNTQAKDLFEKAAYVEELKQKAAAVDVEVNDLRQTVLELEKSLFETRSEADKLMFLSNTQAKDLSEQGAYVEELKQKAAAVDIEVNDLRQKVLELEKSLAETRSDADKLSFLSNTHAKDLSEKAAYVEELKHKESGLNIEVNDLRQKVLELEKSLAETRSEVDRLCLLSNTQAKDLSEKAAYVEELEQKALALDIEVNNLRQKVLELEKSLADTRAEADKLRFLSNMQGKDLSEKAAYVEELEQKASALDIEVNDLRQKVLEREKFLAETRSEAGNLRSLSNTQDRDLSQKAAYVQELEQNLSALQEEVVRLKDAGSDEAKKVEKLKEEIETRNKHLDVLRDKLQEATNKLKSQGGMAAATVTAQNKPAGFLNACCSCL
ncbi:hypothetical protein O6H91_Y131200 [Diphasiastrum complanatum]|nr:hypothetical protein O6H91_Y131200 [Diphasiastrum complanatum]